MQAASVAFATEVTGNDLCVAAEIDITYPVFRTNLCTNPSFEAGVQNWGVDALGTQNVQVAGGLGVSGIAALFGVWPAAAATHAAFVSYTFTTVVGKTYTVSAYVKIANSGPNVDIGVVGYGYGGQANSGSVFQRISYTFTATSTSAKLVLSNASTIAASGFGVIVDAVLIEQASNVGSYFDGDTGSGASWIGPFTSLGVSRLPINPFTLTRTNLCTNPSFEDPAGTTNWAAGGSVIPALATISPAGWIGNKAMLVTWGTAGTLPLVQTTFATTIGQVYTCSAYVLTPAGSPTALAVCNGAFGTSNTSNGRWQRISVTFTATATSHAFQIWPGTAPTSGNTMQVDAVLIERSATLGPFFDGSSSLGAWNGSAYLSASSLYNLPAADITLACESFRVERQMTTDMPAGTRLIAGYPSASANVVLSGLVDGTNEDLDAMWLFNRYDKTSPLYRTDAGQAVIVIRAGLDTTGDLPELLTQFVGVIDDYSVDSDSGIVSIDCLDKRQTMRTTPKLPPVVEPYPATNYHYDIPTGTYFLETFVYYAGLTSLWAIDTLLRNNNIHACPPPRPQCLLFVSMQGSAWPQVYDRTAPWLNPTVAPYTAVSTGVALPSAMYFLEDNGHYSGQIPQDFYISVPVKPSDNSTPLLSNGGCFFVEFSMASFGSYTDALGDSRRPEFNVRPFTSETVHGQSSYTFPTAKWVTSSNTPNSGAVWAFTSPSGIITTFAVTSGWHRCAMQINITSNSTFTTTMWVDGVQMYSATNETSTNPAPGQELLNSIAIWGVACDAVQVTGERYGLPITGYTPTAYLDKSLNPISATPDFSTTDPWSTIQAICQAELGIAGFDELGTFRFKNRITLTTGDPVRPVSSSTSLKGLVLDTPMSAYANHVTSPINPISTKVENGGAENLFEVLYSAPSGAVYILPALSPVYTNLVSVSAAIVSQLVSYAIPDPGVPNGPYQPTSGLRACTTADGTGAAVTTGIVMTVVQITATTVQYTLQNNNAFAVYLVTPTGAGYDPSEVGQPFLMIGGWPIIATPTAPSSVPTTINPQTGLPNAVLTVSSTADAQWPDTAYGGAVSNPRGEVLLALPANEWLQKLAPAQDMVEAVLEDLIYPRPLVAGVPIVADPRLQLTDRITVEDLDLTGINDDAVIVGSSLTVSAADWTQTLDLRLVAVPGYWTLNVVGSSEMGATTWV